MPIAMGWSFLIAAVDRSTSPSDDRLAVDVGDLDADRALAWDGREDAHVRARHRVRDVLATAE